ncbi:hypothetical protein LCM08_25215 [Salipiger pacificus]|nr:hypothetical protein [Alloyangia pacifica]MCA0948241.1 hypothetical protein [Alloyangia pacifica]
MRQKAEDFMTALLLALVLCILFGAGLFAIFGTGTAPQGALSASLPGALSGVVLVIAPPWGHGAAALVTWAGGRQIGPVSAPFGTFASFDGPAPVDRLRELGGWGAWDAGALATICGVQP